MDGVGLQADCSQCFGLCCVAPGFAASADFAIDKPPGHPCPHLQGDFGCGIHADLRPRGFPGCTVFDCYGAGQQVAQVTYAGRSWRTAPEVAGQMFEVFGVMRQLHELLWHVAEALALTEDEPLRAGLNAAYADVEAFTQGDPAGVLAVDLAVLRAVVNPLLVRVSDAVRAVASGTSAGRRPAAFRGADLAGADLRGADLRAAGLRGALLVGADLRDADLRLAGPDGGRPARRGRAWRGPDRRAVPEPGPARCRRRRRHDPVAVRPGAPHSLAGLSGQAP